VRRLIEWLWPLTFPLWLVLFAVFAVLTLLADGLWWLGSHISRLTR